MVYYVYRTRLLTQQKGVISMRIQKHITECTQEHRVCILEETLSDGSLVYEVNIASNAEQASVTVACINYDAAKRLFDLLSDNGLYLMD